MALVLTQVYVEPKQKEERAAKAKATGRKSSDLVREAVDDLLLGVSPVEQAQLDEATKRAEADLKAMVKALDANARRRNAFMAEITKLRAVAHASRASSPTSSTGCRASACCANGSTS